MLGSVKGYAPHRISYCGGGTDFPSFYNEYGGAVISCAVNRFSVIYARQENSGNVHLIAKNMNQTYDGSIRDLKRQKELSMPLKAILGSDQPVRMTIESQVPPGSGLGSSGTLAVNLMNVINALQDNKVIKPPDLAEKAYFFEAKIMDKAVGRQDHYAAAFGGMNFFEFSSNGIEVQTFPNDTVKEIHSRSILFYLGVTRVADKILKRQEKRVQQRNEDTIEALRGMNVLTHKMKRSINKRSFSDVGHILEEAWILKKRYTSGISNKFIEKVHSIALQSGAAGAKVTGAGGGGHFLVYAEPEQRRKIIKNLIQLGCEHIPFQVCQRGAWVEHAK